MVQRQIAARGVRDQAVLDAMAAVPREAFLAPELAEFAYDDTPLPIPQQQTISQPYVVAFMTEALRLRGGERVLEVGTGSGYAAAVLACIAGEVYTVERHAELAQQARRRLARLGYDNVAVLHGDGTLGWPEHAPYDGIVVTAGGPAVPQALLDQLAPGGRLVMPVGRDPTEQTLLRVTRLPDGGTREEDLGGVRFVPLIGAQGWPGHGHDDRAPPLASRGGPSRRAAAALVRALAEPFDAPETLDPGPLLERIGNCRVVLLGSATRGTSEFQRVRARLTRALVERAGFGVLALETDWADAALLDAYVHGEDAQAGEHGEAFARAPAWAWRSRETLELLAWLREHAIGRPVGERVVVRGLDLYGRHASLHQALDYLDAVDPRAARTARERFGCLTPWQADPRTYGRAAPHGLYRSCEHEVVAMLRDLLARRLRSARGDAGEALDEAFQARLLEGAERHYHALYHGGGEAWDLRARHLFETLEALLARHGPDAKVVVWAHNAQAGDARGTEPGARGRLSLGQLVRGAHGERAYLVGQLTDRGTLLASRRWDGPPQACRLRAAHRASHERLLRAGGLPAALFPLRPSRGEALAQELSRPRLERAVDVVYRPSSELFSHYFHASLSLQLDEVVWIEQTSALRPLSAREERALPGSHPFSRPTVEMVG
jgi:protein-L-isoaspartate(D-aspartate) O-methyltransferase